MLYAKHYQISLKLSNEERWYKNVKIDIKLALNMFALLKIILPLKHAKCFVGNNLGAVHKCQHFHECTNHTLSGGGGLWKSTFYPYTINFLVWFLLFSWGFLALKKCWCVLFFLVRGESQKVYGLYIHENFDIYGRPLNCLLQPCLSLLFQAPAMHADGMLIHALILLIQL